jgi:hypothetical protein
MATQCVMTCTQAPYSCNPRRPRECPRAYTACASRVHVTNQVSQQLSLIRACLVSKHNAVRFNTMHACMAHMEDSCIDILRQTLLINADFQAISLECFAGICLNSTVIRPEGALYWIIWIGLCARMCADVRLTICFVRTCFYTWIGMCVCTCVSLHVGNNVCIYSHFREDVFMCI